MAKPVRQVKKVAAKTPIVKDIVKVANDPLRAVKPGGGLAQSQRPDTFAGAPKEVIAASEQQVAKTIKDATGLGPATPKAAVPAGESEMAATSDQTRRRRARGIATGSRGVTGSARTTRKRLLGE